MARDECGTTGLACVGLPQSDNRGSAYITVVVDPERQGRGIGTRLLDEAIRIAKAHGRDIIQGFTHERLAVSAGGLHRPSGRLVGFTRVRRYPHTDQVVDQWETLVLSAHRGHGLGWLLKTHSHAALRRQWPTIRRIVTGNASENSHMLAINRRLGYEPFAASGWYQRKETGFGGAH